MSVANYLRVWFAAFLVLGCGGQSTPVKVPAKKPDTPLKLTAPAAPPKPYEGDDLSSREPGELAGAALKLAREGKHKEAIQFQHWSVMAAHKGQYDLACFYGLAGEKEAAFYWLQEAAVQEGVDADHASDDSDLSSVRSDPRWEKVQAFLKAYGEYWKESDLHTARVILPKSYQKGTPIGVVIGLHGRGADPDQFFNEIFQPFADDLNMAFVSVSGTVAMGPHTFVWSEDAQRDHAQLQRALKEVEDRVTVKADQVVLLGFSQGGQMGFEVAIQNPDSYRGAIVMSPGTTKVPHFDKFVAAPKNRDQGFVIRCGEGEFSAIDTKRDADVVKKAGARLDFLLYEGVDAHTYPPDFLEKLTGWVRFVAEGKN